ncbi:MAG: hypothetical protein U1D33_02545 [bacterium]|nr:hypothetical protein [bacterium]
MSRGNKIASLLFPLLLLSLPACFENVRPNQPPRKTQKKNPPRPAVYQPPRECEDFIKWVLPLPPKKPAPDPSKPPLLLVTEVTAEGRLGEIQISVKTSERIQSLFDNTGPQGFKFGAALLDVYFDEDMVERWGIPSAWGNESNAADKREDEFWVRIELGYIVLSELGARPVEKTGNVEVDSIKKSILGTVATYSFKRKNNKGKWASVPSKRLDDTTGLPSYKTFTEVDGSTIKIKVPYILLDLRPSDAFILHGKIPRKSRPPRLSFKCLRAGY